jgi:hypothetical protein
MAATALEAAGLSPSRGDKWTGQMLQGIRSRIRARCRADPAFAVEVASWTPPPATVPPPRSEEERAEAAQRDREARRAAEQAAAEANWAVSRPNARHGSPPQWKPKRRV